MDVKVLFVSAMDTADGCLMHIRAGQLGNPTPCDDWKLRDLLQHMAYELLWAPDMLAGRTIAEVGSAHEGDVLGQDFQAAWRRAADAARRAVEAADTGASVHTSFGDITAEEYINQLAGDMYIHSWDADQAVNCSLRFEPAAARTLYEYYQPHAAAWRQSGIFGPAAAVADEAPVAERLLGLLGRQGAGKITTA